LIARLSSLFDPQAQPWRPAGAGLLALTADRLTPAFLRRALAAQPASYPGDPNHEAGLRLSGREGPWIDAAVLIPLVMRTAALQLMLTQRAAHLNAHAGQICFPGGRLESWDASAEAGALREAQEETGLAPEYVEVLGCLPVYQTVSGFSVTPVVALVRPGFTLVPDSVEVADVFEVPFAYLMDPAHHRLHRIASADGSIRHFYSMPWQDRFIWGATAAMLRSLYHLLRSA